MRLDIETLQRQLRLIGIRKDTVAARAVKELIEYKAIEEEFGIGLVTLFKAISNGIYVKTKNGISKHETIHLMKWQQTNIYCLYYRPYSHIWFKDYGITWALTKEELE